MFNTKPRNILILACSIFLVFGIFNSAIGPVLAPWVAGILLEKVSPLAYALYMVAGGGFMLILLISLSRLIKKDSTE